VSAIRVYKVGGPALEDPALLPLLAAELKRDRQRSVVVHGGGGRVDRLLRSFSIESRFVEGRRATSAEAMEVVEMVLSGLVNKALASGLSAAGLPAVGLSGRDAGLIRTRPQPELGRVGVPDAVDARVLRAQWDAGFVPVVSPVSADGDGGAINVNADEAALAIARAVGARSLIYVSDVEGVRAGAETLERLGSDEAARLMSQGTIAGGMALKVRVALAAVAAGIPEVVIAGGARLRGGFPGTRLLAEEPVEAAR
jgi:acetylglutamate kinase